MASTPTMVRADDERTVRAPRVVALATAVPDRFLIVAMSAMLATSITVQLSVFHPYTVFPLFIALVAATWRLAPTPLPAPRAIPGHRQPPRNWQLIGSVTALLIVIVWVLVQRQFDSELLSVRRDPAIYTLRGFWLMDHSSPDVYLNQQLLDIKQSVPTAGLDFGTETGRLVRYFQSTTVVPGLIAIAGWIGGPSLLLQGDVLIGGAALLCLYALARRMAGPVFGLVPVVALACSMPMAAFSRVAYTEPLSVIAVVACLLGLWEAARTGRKAMWLLAGFGAGAVAIARIDGWVVVIGGLVAIGIWGAATSSRESRRSVLTGLSLFCLGAFPAGALGYTDLHFHSPDYLLALDDQWKLLIEGVAVVTVVAFGVIAVPGVGWLAGRLRRHSGVVARVLVIGVGAVMLLMIARPLLYHSHFYDTPTRSISGRQASEGQPVDATRTYDEQSLVWISWYFGWPTVILACLAALYAVRKGIRQRFAPIVLVTAVVAVNAALYLNVVSISPDQIWARRRFLPVILPGGLLLIGWGLNELYEGRVAIAARLRRFLPAGPPGVRVTTALAAVLGVLVALYPISTWGDMFPVREGAGQYDLVQRVCAQIRNQKVLLVGPIPVMGYYQPTFRNLCGSSVVTLPSSDVGKLGAAGAKADERSKIAGVISAWGETSVKVVAFNPNAPLPWTANPGPAMFSDTYHMWESTLSRRPQSATTETTSIWLGTAMSDGSVVPGL